MIRRIGWLTVFVSLLAGCASMDAPQGPPLPRDLAARPDGKVGVGWLLPVDEREARARIAGLIAVTVKDRPGWAADLYGAFVALDIPHATETYCAAIVVIEQESGFQVDPMVPGLPEIVRRELDRRADKFGIPKMLITAALKTHSPDGRSYDERINALRTEKQLNALYGDMTSELPFGRQLLAGYNPVRTGGPMQVSIKFAEQQALERPYPYPVAQTIRDEVFSRRGGVYFGSAILLDYAVDYDQVAFRFADFNAGRYAARNAALQAAVARLAHVDLELDGDLLRYRNGDPDDEPSQFESALRTLGPRLKLSDREIRRELLKEKLAGLTDSVLYQRLFALADGTAGKAVPRQVMPGIDLKSPKIQRKLTTEWFARRVDERYRACLARTTAP